MDKPAQGFFESDEDYAQRVARQADERSVELATGEKPSQGFFESDETYAKRIRRAADESEIKLSSGERPSQGFFESDADYQQRISLEAKRSVVASQDESRASQGFFEEDRAYRQRMSRQSDEAAIERETGSKPSQGFFESDEDYRNRIWHEARELRAAREFDEPEHESSESYTYSYESSDSGSSSSSSGSSSGWGGWLILIVVVFGVLGALGDRPSSSASGSSSSRSAFVNSPGLNLRSGPGREYAIVTSLLRGDPVQILGSDSRDSRWVRVQAAGSEGWVNSDYLSDRRESAVTAVTSNGPPASTTVVRPRITLQYQVTSDRQIIDGVQVVLRRNSEWWVGEPERVLPAGENRPEVYGGLRYYFESDLALARAVCHEVVSELARQGMTVTMPLWPMVTGQREGRFHASPGLIEVWVSPLPPATESPAPLGQCGR